MGKTWNAVMLAAGMAGAVLAGPIWAGRPIEAQEAQTRKPESAGAQAAAGRDPGSDTLVLIYPTGDRATSSLLVEALTPAEVPVGKSYQYMIRVTNLTDNLVLEDVKVQQTEAKSLTIESAEVLGREDQKAQPNETQKAQPNETQKAQQDEGQKAQQGNQAQGHHTQSGGNPQGAGPWTIDRLGPGESRTIRVTAVGESEGQAQTCIKVSYEPSLCVATRFVQPEISLGKSAPEQADLCRPLELRYLIKNSGTGVARGITIRDELPEGLKTGEGQGVVTFEVGDLAAGQEREFRTTVHASQTGTFGSRAVAQGQDVETHSNRVETKIIAAKLAVKLDGPRAQYIHEPMTYQATVTNDGTAPAIGTRLRIDVAEGARVLNTGRSEPGDAEPQASGRTLTWDLGTIEPGANRVVRFTVSGRQEGNLEHQAVASSLCEAGGDRDEAVTVTQSVATRILTLPALVVEMVDRNDPVQVGQEEVYTVVVRNQGSGADQDVQIVAKIPENFEFVEAQGTTQVTAEGKKLTFAPVERLGPNEKAQWNIRVKATAPGDVRNEIQLTSAYLQDPLPEFEPTRVIE